MILKETLALYRAEDRRAREVEKLRATSRRTLNVSETEGAPAADSSRWSLVLVSRNVSHQYFGSRGVTQHYAPELGD